MSVSHLVLEAQSWLLQQPPGGNGIPNPGAEAPPGSEAIGRVVGYMRWVAGISVLGLFFGGIVAATAGRLWDHHGSGRLGARMIVGSLALALLFGLGYTLVSQFAGSTA
ncbi:hypothetical protein EV383_6217 [Pseudonocardia sediminis]|uniref:Uncharacterized protein n=1 Tax=Pseudonocardia sediminis TaxID=1397368 RepID=A0A4Q7U7M4_PSEST|nr:hypothetical protein [Pseudonocardia sediminis]RZT75477.1 hypothetical protein EV383_6217 [Pseudonocardia sediminis]